MEQRRDDTRHYSSWPCVPMEDFKIPRRLYRSNPKTSLFVKRIGGRHSKNHKRQWVGNDRSEPTLPLRDFPHMQRQRGIAGDIVRHDAKQGPCQRGGEGVSGTKRLGGRTEIWDVVGAAIEYNIP